MKWIDKLLHLPESAKASAAYAICNILQRCMSFISLPLFTRLLTPEQYGQATIYASWSSLLEIFVSLYLPYGTFSKAMIKFEDDRDGYIASVDTICLSLGSIFLIFYYPWRGQWNSLFQLPTALIFFMVVNIVANTATRCWMAKQRFDYKYKSVIFVTMLMSILAPMVAFFTVINSEEKGYARIIGNASVGLIIGMYFWGRNLFVGKHLYQKQFWHYALTFNIPLIPYYLGQMIYNQSDRIMISHLVGTDKAGIYGVAYTLAMALGFVLTSINNSYVPWLYRQMKAGLWHGTRKVSTLIAVLMSALLMVVVLFTPEIILVTAGEAYKEAVWCVPPIAMSLLMLLYAQFFINVEFYFEEKSYLVIGMVCSGFVNVVLNYLLIPRLGFIVAAYTTLFSFAMTVAINYVFYRKILREQQIEDVMYDYRKLALLAGGVVALGMGTMMVYEFRWLRLACAVGIFTVLWFRQHEIFDWLQVIRN